MSTDATELVFDGERFVPGAGAGIAYEHWARYALAAEMVRGKDVLDVGCGEGYGAALVSAFARSVVAFDASADAIAHARRAYDETPVRFEQATVREFFERCEDRFDAIVSFELIEHLTVEDQAFLLDGIRRALRPGGFALISTPDKLLYSDRNLFSNPFHIREYYRDEFEEELRARFAHVRILDQQVFTGCVVTPPLAETARAFHMAWTDLPRARGTCRSGLKTSGEYLVAVAGNDPLPDTPAVVLADFARKLIAEALASERRTADRLSRELEEARRAWESVRAEAAKLGAELLEARRRASDLESRAASEVQTARAEVEEARKDAAIARAALEEARTQAARALEDARLEAARARVEAEAERGRASEVELRYGPAARKVAGVERRVRSLAQAVGRLPTVSWLTPRVGLGRRGGERRLIEESGLFDPVWYAATYPDVRADPIAHYLEHGAAEGRDPCRWFDTSFYLASYPDVARAGVNPLTHFITHGWKELRRPHPDFDTEFYLASNPDVREAGVNPLAHFVRHGEGEGRLPNARTMPGARGALDLGPAVERWRAEIDAHPRRALVIDGTLPTPDRDSGSITTLENLKALQSLGYAVTLVPADLRHDARYTEPLAEAGFWCLTGRDIPSVAALLESHGAAFDVVVVARAPIAYPLMPFVARCCPQATVVFESMDIHFVREEREAALVGTPEARERAARTREQELDLVRRADATIVHSTHELALLERLVPGAAVHLMPYVIEPRGRGPALDGRRDLMFLGGFRHRPNVDAVQWFVRDVLPLVRRELPDVRLLVVGSDPPEEIRRLASEAVTVTGWVEDLSPLFGAVRVSVAPLRYGAGYKGKVAMSMAHGVPLVLTSVAAEGMELRDGEQVLVADDPAAMAAAVVRLYRDAPLWERLASASYEFVLERFSPRAARSTMERILRAAGARGWEDAALRTHAVAAEPQPGHAIFPSRFMRELHRAAGVAYQASSLVPHGVEFRHAAGARRADRSRLVEPGVLRLLFAGRVTHFKGVHTVVEALPSIVEALPGIDVRLRVVGDQSDADYVGKVRAEIAARGLGDRVEFAPAAPESELFDLFQQHDIYVFPSLFEPFALTLILALEAGIPTVASATGGNVDLVVDHATGLLFPAGDARALARAVAELAANGALRSAVAEAGREAASRLTLDAMIDGVERCLVDAATRGGTEHP